MERTSGSAAACWKSRSALASKLSYGWWRKRSPLRITSKRSAAPSAALAAVAMRDGVIGCHVGARSFGWGRSAASVATERSITPSISERASPLSSSPSRRSVRTSSDMPVSTSRRTTLPNLRCRSSSSIAASRSSASPSSTSMSASRVMRKRCESISSCPAKSS